MKRFFVVLFLHVYLLVMLSIFKHCMIFWLAMERHTLTVLEELRDQNRTIISLLHQLLSRSLVNGQDADGELPSGLVIPVQNVEELDRLNSEVADSDIRAKLVCTFYVFKLS